MKRTFAAAASAAAIAWAAEIGAAHAQSNPCFNPGTGCRALETGDVPSAIQWDSFFAGKQDYPVPSGGIGASALAPGAAAANLGFTPRKILNPVDYGAQCDGATDDTTALQAWAAAITANATAVVPGVCVFKSPIVFPLVNYVTLSGGTLLYAGASTTGTLVKIGSASPSGTVVAGWNIVGLDIQSSTIMTGGDALLIGGAYETTLRGVIVGGQVGSDNGNFFNAIEVIGTSGLKIAQSQARGSHYGYYVHGSQFSTTVDNYLTDFTVAKSGVGIVLGGGVAGFNFLSGDDVGNGENVIFDQEGAIFSIATSAGSASGSTVTMVNVSGVAAGYSVTDLTAPSAIPAGTTVASISTNTLTLTNSVTSVGSGDALQFGAPVKQAFFGPLAAIDGTDTTLCISGATACGVGMEIADIGNSNSPTIITDNAWHSFAQKQCVLVQSTVLYYTLLMSGAHFGNCLSAFSDTTGSFDNESVSASASFLIKMTGLYFSGNTGQDIYNVATAKPILMSGVSFDSTNGKITGSIAGTYSTSQGSVHLRSDTATAYVQSAPTFASVVGAGTTSSQIGAWFQNNTMIPGGMDAASGGGNFNIGNTSYAPNKLYRTFEQALGSAPTATGTCAVTSQTGGNTAGTFTASGACVAGTYILTFASSASNGWDCSAEDRTTTTDTVQQTASAVGSATFKATTANSDVIGFHCFAY